MWEHWWIRGVYSVYRAVLVSVAEFRGNPRDSKAPSEKWASRSPSIPNWAVTQCALQQLRLLASSPLEHHFGYVEDDVKNRLAQSLNKQLYLNGRWDGCWSFSWLYTVFLVSCATSRVGLHIFPTESTSLQVDGGNESSPKVKSKAVRSPTVGGLQYRW